MLEPLILHVTKVACLMQGMTAFAPSKCIRTNLPGVGLALYDMLTLLLIWYAEHL